MILPERPATISSTTNRYSAIARALAWTGFLAIIILTVVPAEDRPVTGLGQWLEHFAAFALLGGAFTKAYGLSITRYLLLAVLFCAGIELLQVPLPTRHARVSDFLIDTVGVWVAVVCIFVARRFLTSTVDASLTKADRHTLM